MRQAPSSLPILFCRPDGIIESHNEAAARLVSSQPTSLDGTLVVDLLPHHQRDSLSTAIQRALSVGKCTIEANLATQMAGSARTCVWLEKTPDLPVVRITLRRLEHECPLEGTISAQAAQHRTFLEALDAGVLVYDSVGGMVSWNTRALELLGIQEATIRGRTGGDPTWDVVGEDGKPMNREDSPSERAKRTRRPVRDVILGVASLPGGTHTWMSVSAVPLLDQEQQVDKVVVTLVDATERMRQKRLWELLEQDFPFAAATLKSSPGNSSPRHAQRTASERPSGILVVDDDDNMRRALVRLLKKDGHRVLFSTNGLEALEIIRSTPIWLVIADVVMPDMDGVSLSTALRRHRPEVQVILSSGYSPEKLNAAGVPVDHLLQKPYAPEELLNRVQTLKEKSVIAGPDALS